MLEELGRALKDAGYVEGALPGWGEDPALVRRRLPRPDQLTTLIELFALGDAVPLDQARHALAPLPLERLADAGIVGADADCARGAVGIDAWGDTLFACDRPPPREPDHVTGVGPASRTLASLTVRRPVRRALDLGTGCGVQALLAARHAESVVATDVNPRALRFAVMNARLNGIGKVEFRRGSLFDPVDDEPFEVFVSNPPFVVSPDRAFLFRDSGAENELVQAVVAGAAQRLHPGGFATVLCNWSVGEGEDWREAIRKWTRDLGCDVWLVYYGSDDPLTYATKWNAHLRSDEEAYAAALDRWLAYHQAAGVSTVASGGVVLRRRGDGSGWFRADEAGVGPAGSASGQILRVFAAQDLIRGLRSEEALLDLPLILVESHRLDQTLLFQDNGYTAQPALVTPSEGAGVRAEVEPAALHVLFRLDGRRPLGVLVSETAEETGLDEGGLRAAALRAARSLLEGGCAVVVGTDGEG